MDYEAMEGRPYKLLLELSERLLNVLPDLGEQGISLLYTFTLG